MQLYLYNTKTRVKELFIPIQPKSLTMYVCGPTVYNHPHIGNARSVIVYDLLYRILIELYGSKSVKYVRNITDVDDKIIQKAKQLGKSTHELTKQITNVFHDNMKYLNCLSPNIEPKATDHITHMIDLIQKLIDLDIAYVADNHVYFNVIKAKDYNQLSGRSLDEMLDGVRIINNKSKKYYADFVLWKPANNTNDDLNFDSPWGKGRPGWHIECSAMSYQYLGENFDIHGGGTDLIFPHHTNEIAQSRSAFPGSNFATYWIHNGLVINKEKKMSKSIGNIITVQQLIDQNISGDVIRLLLLSTHYRKPLDFNKHALLNASKIIDYWLNAINDVDEDHIANYDKNIPIKFFNSLLDDMNTSLAIKIINDYAKVSMTAKDQKTKNSNQACLIKCARSMGLLKELRAKKSKLQISETLIAQLINERQKAKESKDWKQADHIRNKLKNYNIILQDHKDGKTTWNVST